MRINEAKYSSPSVENYHERIMPLGVIVTGFVAIELLELRFAGPAGTIPPDPHSFMMEFFGSLVNNMVVFCLLSPLMAGEAGAVIKLIEKHVYNHFYRILYNYRVKNGLNPISESVWRRNKTGLLTGIKYSNLLLFLLYRIPLFEVNFNDFLMKV